MAKKIKSSHKGGTYERDVCKMLSLWYSRGKRDDIFWRTAGSGSRATTRSKKGLDTADSSGDVQAIHESGKKFTDIVNIEIKRGYTKKGKNQSANHQLSITNILDKVETSSSKNKPILIEWFQKGIKECKRHNKDHLLIIYRRDRRRSCIAMPFKTFEYLRDNNREFMFPHDGTLCVVNTKRYQVALMPLDDFLAWCPPKAFFKQIVHLKNRPPYSVGKYAGQKIKDLKKSGCFPKGFA